MIYLVRHGETDLNKQKKFYGSSDVSINQTGVRQAQLLKEKLSLFDFETIYVSGLRRTKETATIINDAKKQPIIVSSNFNEKCFGLWEGLDADQIEAAYPQVWQTWLDHPFEVIPPDAEAFSHFEKRVLHGFKQLIEKKEQSIAGGNTQPILIVGHLGVLRVIHQFLKPDSLFWDFDVPQGDYFVVRSELLWGK